MKKELLNLIFKDNTSIADLIELLDPVYHENATLIASGNRASLPYLENLSLDQEKFKSQLSTRTTSHFLNAEISNIQLLEDKVEVKYYYTKFGETSDISYYENKSDFTFEKLENSNRYKYSHTDFSFQYVSFKDFEKYGIADSSKESFSKCTF